jgi:hypothetical protein
VIQLVYGPEGVTMSPELRRPDRDPGEHRRRARAGRPGRRDATSSPRPGRRRGRRIPGLTSDLDEVPRPPGGAIDIGAFEYAEPVEARKARPASPERPPLPRRRREGVVHPPDRRAPVGWHGRRAHGERAVDGGDAWRCAPVARDFAARTLTLAGHRRRGANLAAGCRPHDHGRLPLGASARRREWATEKRD